MKVVYLIWYSVALFLVDAVAVLDNRAPNSELIAPAVSFEGATRLRRFRVRRDQTSGDDFSTSTASYRPSTTNAEDTVQAAVASATQSLSAGFSSSGSASASSSATQANTVSLSRSTETASAILPTILPGQLPLKPTLTPAVGLAGAILFCAGLVYGILGVNFTASGTFLSNGFLGALGVTVLIEYVSNPPHSPGIQGAFLAAIFIAGLSFGGLSLIFKDVARFSPLPLGGFTMAMWFLMLRAGGLITSMVGKLIFIILFMVVFTIGFMIVGRWFSWGRRHQVTTWGGVVGSAWGGAAATVLGVDCWGGWGGKEFWLWIWDLNEALFPANATTYPTTRAIRAELAVIVLLALLCGFGQRKLLIRRRLNEHRLEAMARARDEELGSEELARGRAVVEEVNRERDIWEQLYGGGEEWSKSAVPEIKEKEGFRGKISEAWAGRTGNKSWLKGWMHAISARKHGRTEAVELQAVKEQDDDVVILPLARQRSSLQTQVAGHEARSSNSVNAEQLNLSTLSFLPFADLGDIDRRPVSGSEPELATSSDSDYKKSDMEPHTGPSLAPPRASTPSRPLARFLSQASFNKEYVDEEVDAQSDTSSADATIALSELGNRGSRTLCPVEETPEEAEKSGLLQKDLAVVQAASASTDATSLVGIQTFKRHSLVSMKDFDSDPEISLKSQRNDRQRRRSAPAVLSQEAKVVGTVGPLKDLSRSKSRPAQQAPSEREKQIPALKIVTQGAYHDPGVFVNLENFDPRDKFPKAGGKYRAKEWVNHRIDDAEPPELEDLKEPDSPVAQVEGRIERLLPKMIAADNSPQEPRIASTASSSRPVSSQSDRNLLDSSDDSRKSSITTYTPEESHGSFVGMSAVDSAKFSRTNIIHRRQSSSASLRGEEPRPIHLPKRDPSYRRGTHKSTAPYDPWADLALEGIPPVTVPTGPCSPDSLPLSKRREQLKSQLQLPRTVSQELQAPRPRVQSAYHPQASQENPSLIHLAHNMRASRILTNPSSSSKPHLRSNSIDSVASRENLGGHNALHIQARTLNAEAARAGQPLIVHTHNAEAGVPRALRGNSMDGGSRESLKPHPARQSSLPLLQGQGHWKAAPGEGGVRASARISAGTMQPHPRLSYQPPYHHAGSAPLLTPAAAANPYVSQQQPPVRYPSALNARLSRRISSGVLLESNAGPLAYGKGGRPNVHSVAGPAHVDELRLREEERKRVEQVRRAAEAEREAKMAEAMRSGELARLHRVKLSEMQGKARLLDGAV